MEGVMSDQERQERAGEMTQVHEPNGAFYSCVPVSALLHAR